MCVFFFLCFHSKDHPRSSIWTLDFEPAFLQRFLPTLSPRSIFSTGQRFLPTLSPRSIFSTGQRFSPTLSPPSLFSTGQRFSPTLSPPSIFSTGQRFLPTLSPPSLFFHWSAVFTHLEPTIDFYPGQRFSLSNHVTSGSHEPTIPFYPLVSGFPHRKSYDVITLLSTNQEPVWGPSEPPLLLVHTPRQANPMQEHLGLFVACFGIRLLIINFKI